MMPGMGMPGVMPGGMMPMGGCVMPGMQAMQLGMPMQQISPLSMGGGCDAGFGMMPQLVGGGANGVHGVMPMGMPQLPSMMTPLGMQTVPAAANFAVGSLGAPMLQGMMGLPNVMGHQPATSSTPPAPAKPAVVFDSEVQKLCDHFKIDSACAEKLNEEISKRAATKAADLEMLWELLEDVGDPSYLLAMKIDEMVSGEFVGKIKADREVEALSLNCSLNDDAKARLNELVARRADRKGEDLVRIEGILKYTDTNPSSTVLRYVALLLDKKISSLPDLSEAEDTMKKFKLADDARQKLAEVVLQRADESSSILGGLELYFEGISMSPSVAMLNLAERLMAGGAVPDAERERRREQRERERSRERSRERRSPSRSRRSRSRGRR